MRARTSFVINNDTGKKMCIMQEPEGFEFMVPIGEDVVIEADSCLESVILRHSIDIDGVTIGVINDENNYRVLYKGEDVFKDVL